MLEVVHLNLVYFIFSYFDFRSRMENIFQFIYLFDKTNYSQSDFILSINIFKSFLFNTNIPILNSENSETMFFDNFICLSDKEDNELIVLELINHFVECLDSYFGNVCELDIIFNFQKSYYIIEEILCGGLIQETDRNEIQKLLSIQDMKLKEEIEEDYAPK